MKLVGEHRRAGDLGDPRAAAAAAATTVPGMHEFMLEAGSEAVRTALAAGSRVRADLRADRRRRRPTPSRYVDVMLDMVLHQLVRCPTPETTVLQDWMKGRRSEVDQINGLVVDEQRRLGGNAPRTRGPSSSRTGSRAAS